MDIREFHKLWGDAMNAIDGAADAEERAKNADRRFKNVSADTVKMQDMLVQAKNDTTKELADRKIELDKIAQDHAAKLDAEKKAHDGYIENARGQVEQASNTLTNLQMQIREARADIEQLNLERSKLRAAFADSVARL